MDRLPPIRRASSSSSSHCLITKGGGLVRRSRTTISRGCRGQSPPTLTCVLAERWGSGEGSLTGWIFAFNHPHAKPLQPVQFYPAQRGLDNTCTSDTTLCAHSRSLKSPCEPQRTMRGKRILQARTLPRCMATVCRLWTALCAEWDRWRSLACLNGNRTMPLIMSRVMGCSVTLRNRQRERFTFGYAAASAAIVLPISAGSGRRGQLMRSAGR